MKKIILFACFCFAVFNMLHAQVKDSAVKELLQGRVAGLNITKADMYKPKPYFQPKFAVNGKLVGRGNMCLNPADIDAVKNIENTKNDSAVFRKYGLKNTDVIEITMKPGAKLFSLNEILHNYHIYVNDWKLPVYIDGRTINNRKTFIASADYIQSVQLDGGGNIVITSKKDVIVTGFKETDRAPFTGSKTIITEKDIKDQPVDNLKMLLNGKVCVISRQSLFSGVCKKIK